MVKAACHRRSASQSGFTIAYQYWQCGRAVDQVGLVHITIAYQPRDLGLIQPSGTFTNDYHREGDITHSGRDYVLCGVITIVLMWLRQALV